MDHQGAGFAFDANMDFSNMFAAPQAAFKPADDTSGFFFADEAIDTTAASSFIDPVMFDTTPQGSFDMQHGLTLDNTSATPAWNAQLQSTADTFPSTPLQPFNAMSTQFSSLGKRPLQLETHEYPQSKRHAGFDFPLFPTPPATTEASWALEPTSSSTSQEGLTDEAADVCSIWFNKYNVLPSDRHIDSLSQLTGESAEAIRSWFGRLLKQGMGGSQSDSAYKSQTSLIQQQQDTFWHDPTYQTELLQASPPQLLLQQPENTVTPETSPSVENVGTTTAQAATTSRGNKKRCSPTDDVELLSRDPRKIYQCTRKCGKRYGRKNDWKRNEEEGYPCKSWVCSLCISEGVENVKPCYRKYHFVQHFRNIHSTMNPEDYDEASTVYSETEFPRKCGFCRHRFECRQERIDHIADHFKQGKCMLDWRDEEDNDNDDSADDDDDNARPDGNGYDGAPSSQPPNFDPRSDNGSKYFGNNGSGSGSTGQPPQGGFYQFQLSQFGESQLYCADQPIKPITLSPNISQSSTLPESDGIMPLKMSAGSHSEHLSKEEDNTTVLARNTIAYPIKEEQETSLQHKESRLPQWNFTIHPQEDPLAGSDIQCPESSVDIIPRGRSPAGINIPQIPKKSRSFLSVKLLGAGGFSTVDEVIHQQTGLHVGRKTLKNRDRTAIEELKKEVSVLQKLRHPHIIRFLGAYSKGDKMSILLSPVAETTLAGWLERTSLQKPANLLETIVTMFGCLASSVRYIHEQRPVVKHMDIKPQNILIVGSDQEIPHVILCDFGVSSAEDLQDHQSKALTRQYVAPEVFEGFVRKQAADIWSLGCVFSEMASIPFGQDNTGWSAFRKEFSGRTGKYYWQDVPGVQEKLSSFLDTAKTATEQTVVRTIQSMMDANPDKRPDAASLTLVFTPAPCCLNWPNDKATFPGPREEHGGVDAFSPEDIIERHVYESETTAYSDTLSSAKTWLEDCLNTHDACHHLPTRDFSTLPTRLIDMLPDGQAGSCIRIIQSEMLQHTIDPVEYVALSHVWSFNQPLLSSSSLSGMQAELNLQELPVTVRQGIAAAQRLGYRYCWLDALCVLQDSWQEKELECKSMSSTFRNAAVTVVLDQLGSGDHDNEYDQAGKDMSGTTDNHALSLLGPTTGRNMTPARLPASAMLPSSILASPNFGWDTRAWVLQDRLLSRRFLHLGKQLYWECNTLKASETFPCGLSPLVWEKVHTLCSAPETNSHPATEATNVKSKIQDRWEQEHVHRSTSDAHIRVPSTSRIPDHRRRRYRCTQGDRKGAGTEATAKVHIPCQDIEHDHHFSFAATAAMARVPKHKEQASCAVCSASSLSPPFTSSSSSSSRSGNSCSRTRLQRQDADVGRNRNGNVHRICKSSSSMDECADMHVGNGNGSGIGRRTDGVTDKVFPQAME